MTSTMVLTGKAAAVFSKENRRYTLLVLTMLTIALGCMTGIVILSMTDHGKDSLLLTGFVGTLSLPLIQMIRAEAERVENLKAREEIKDEVKAVAKFAVQAADKAKAASDRVEAAVEVATNTPAPSQRAMPQNPDELHDMLKEFANDMCATIAKTAAQEAALNVTRDFQDMVRQEIRKAAQETNRQVARPPRGGEGI